MGIRFYCSHCKRKLNVKAFQGGHQGLCPYCGGSIWIPAESTRPSSKEQRGRQSEPRPTDRGDGTAGSGQPAQPVEKPLPVASPMANAGENTPAALSTPGGPIVPANPNAPVNPIATSAPQQPSEPAGRAPVASSRPVAFPSPIESPAAGGPIDPRSPAPSPGATVGGLPSTPPAAVDPLEEAPEAVWYVRPPGGGQFGPAARDVMQGWIGDGRVTPDSLVWREGWRDWQEASAVFTQLGAQQAAPKPGGIGGAETNSGGVAGDGQRVPTRRRPTVLSMAIIAVLALAIVALSVVFLWIMQHSPS